MNKPSFLGDSDVREMLSWFQTQFESNGHFVHAYRDRSSGRSWSCDGLHDAFASYNWKDKPWTKNKRKLDGFRADLRGAVAHRDEDRAFQTCEEILRWGGVWANNGRYLESRRDSVIPELQHLGSLLSAPDEPSRVDIRRIAADKATECRLNAGFVKVYSVLLDFFVIYDGRVGAALGLMARHFCEQTGRGEVPESLRFAYGSPKEAANAATPKTRNPTAGPYRFPKLRSDSHFHSVQAMRASWFLQAALDGHSGPFSPGEAGFHELAAALFMVGYDLSMLPASSS